MWAPVLLTVLATVWASPVAKRATASDWTSLGCVIDKDYARILSEKVYSGYDNSADFCVDKCASRGYTYAGVQGE